MTPIEIMEIILLLKGNEKVNFSDDINIEFVSYNGLVAKTAYTKNHSSQEQDISQAGLFDFKITTDGVPPTHIQILKAMVNNNLTKQDIEFVYNEGDPTKYDNPKRKILKLIQLLFLEQELNYGSNGYGNEKFQLPSVHKLPRNFFMKFLWKISDLSKEDALQFILSIPIDNNGYIKEYKLVDEKIINHLSGKSWLKDEIIKKYRTYANSVGNNPNWINHHQQIQLPTSVFDKKLKFLIVDLDYTIENDELIARAFGRADDNSRQIIKIHGTRPFFFVRSDAAVPDDPRIVEVVDNGWKSLKDELLKIIYVRYPKDVAQRITCRDCSGNGKVMINGVSTECDKCSGSGHIEVGLRGKFKETWQADVVYTQILRIYYGLVGEIEVSGTNCHISDIRKT